MFFGANHRFKYGDMPMIAHNREVAHFVSLDSVNILTSFTPSFCSVVEFEGVSHESL